MISSDKIQEAIKRLVKAYDPLIIYLYGPYAWGTPDDETDLNLLLIIETSDKQIHKRGDKAFDALLGLEIPKTISIFTQPEFTTYCQDTTSLCYEVKTKGKIVYARD